MVAVYKEMIKCDVVDRDMDGYGDDELLYFHEETKAFSYQCIFPNEKLEPPSNNEPIEDIDEYYYSSDINADVVCMDEGGNRDDGMWSKHTNPHFTVPYFVLKYMRLL